MMSKVPPQVITPIPQPHFFIAPTAGTSYTLQLPQVSSTGGPQSSGITHWPTAPSLAPLRPQPTFGCSEVYFASPPSCVIPAVSVKNSKPLMDPSIIRRDETPPSPGSLPNPVKTEPDLSNCKVSSDNGVISNDDKKHSYPISALIDVPSSSLNRGSRTSSLSSSLSSFRFGGSLSQLWATSLSSLSNKVNSMKSTGNLHAEASMPSLGNQYFAFGGSLPELSLTSLTRLLPNSSVASSTDSSPSTAPGLYTLIQSPLCLYQSQQPLATPFINANGSITFGSFLSSGSSLCSTHQKNDSPPDNHRCDSGSPHHDISPTHYTDSNQSTGVATVAAPGNLSTLAYVASVQKTLETSDQFPLMTVSTQLPSQSPIPHSLSPIPPSSCLSPDDGSLEMDCHVASPTGGPPVGYGMIKTAIKLEEDEPSTMGTYTEVKPHPHHAASGGHIKKDCKDKPYKCDYPGCDRSFSFPAHLRSHVQQIHISYRPCKCDFPGCGKRFYTPQHLNVHRRIHTGERPFVCPYADCGKAFTTAGNLKNHIRTHTGERPYACKFEGCSKRFAEMSSLKKHELTHTGEKPYKCRVCGKAFSQAGSRNTHERKHSRSDETDSKLRRYRIKRVSQDEEL